MLRTRKIRERWISLPILLAVISAAAALGAAQNGPGAPTGSPTPDGSRTGGDSAAGRAIFEGAGNCLSCHRADAKGSILGPNLSGIGALESRDVLKRMLLDPPAKVDPGNRLYEIVTRDGKTTQGKLLNQGPLSLQLLEANGDLVAFPQAKVREGHFVDPPRMPSYQGKLTPEQIDDLVAYLASLRVQETQ